MKRRTYGITSPEQPGSAKSQRITELQALLTEVEDAAEPSRQIDVDLFFAVDWEGQGDSRIAPELTASLDAAFALCERRLPGCIIRLNARFDDASASIAWADERGVHSTYDPNSDDTEANPALAVCAALLRALIAQEEASQSRGDSDV